MPFPETGNDTKAATSTRSGRLRAPPRPGHSAWTKDGPDPGCLLYVGQWRSNRGTGWR